MYENLMIMMLIESAFAGSWNFFSEKEQIERFVNSFQHLPAADELPLLDAQYWTLLERHIASMQLFLPFNQLITVEDKPIQAPLLVCVAMLKRLLGGVWALLWTLCCREWLAEHNVQRMLVQIKSYGRRRMYELNRS